MLKLYYIYCNLSFQAQQTI